MTFWIKVLLLSRVDERLLRMTSPQFASFEYLASADLIVDRVYRSGTSGGLGDEPLSKLLPVRNLGGFRPHGRPTRLVALYTSGKQPDWPDALDPFTGTFLYYGDNRWPGQELHGTSGNRLLRSVFEWTHTDACARLNVPPFLLFDNPGTGGRDVRFRGLLAPGSDRLGSEEDLVAIWRTTRGERFQNYRARFTVLAVPCISRAWIDQLIAGDVMSAHCPAPWRA